MKLWLARHAQTQAPAGTCYGRLDVPAQAAATARAADALAQVLPRGITISHSPLVRCALLAQALAAIRPDLSFKSDDRLAEMDFGSWEGQAWDAIGPTAVQAWTDDFPRHRPGGGESVQAFIARVHAAWHEVRERGADTAWLTHAGVMRAAQLLHAGCTVREAGDWPRADIPFGSWLVLDLPA